MAISQLLPSVSKAVAGIVKTRIWIKALGNKVKCVATVYRDN